MAKTNIIITEPIYQLTQTVDQILFPETKPYNEGYLKVSDIHQIWYGEYGNPEGVPAVVIHGGPGSLSSLLDMRSLDPSFYRIILFDQRGSGKSIPAAEMTENSPAHTIKDMESLRTHLGVDKWVLCGGSFGTTLAIVYGGTHADRCLGVILRGYIGGQEEREFFWKTGGERYPEAWHVFANLIPEAERANLVEAYYKRLMDPDPAVHIPFARAYATYMSTHNALINRYYPLLDNDTYVLSISRTYAHYYTTKSFFNHDQLLNNVNKINHLPAIFVHGRYDLRVRPKIVYELHLNWPNSKLVFVSDAGHVSGEPGILKELVIASEEMKARIK